MNRKSVINLFIKRLKESREVLRENYETHKQASVEAPGAMQSHSDTSKFRFGQLAEAVFSKLIELDRLIEFLEQLAPPSENLIEVGSLVQVKQDGKSQYLLLVPEGAGGQRFEVENSTVQAVSITSPIGQALVNKTVGAEMELRLPAGTTKNIKIDRILN